MKQSVLFTEDEPRTYKFLCPLYVTEDRKALYYELKYPCNLKAHTKLIVKRHTEYSMEGIKQYLFRLYIDEKNTSKLPGRNGSEGRSRTRQK